MTSADHDAVHDAERPAAAPGRTGVTATRRPQWVRAAGSELAMHGYLAAWFWGFVVVATLVAFLVVDHFTDVRVSIVQYASYALAWFPFSLMIIVATMSFTIHVASGMTRRSFVRASLASSVVVAVGFGLVMTLLLLAEGGVYGALGIPHGGPGTGDENGIVAGVWESGVLASWGTYSLIVLAGMVSGLLVGACYYRFKWLRGTLLLPLALVPVLGGQLLIDLGSPDSLGSRVDIGLAWYVPALLLVVALAAAAYAAVCRRADIGSADI